jgi:FtsP/CotA-like multicopper oxidase with cupredoxin domain
VIDLTIGETQVQIGQRTAIAKTINGMLPGPLIRLKEGQGVAFNVTNRTSICEASSDIPQAVVLAEIDGVGSEPDGSSPHRQGSGEAGGTILIRLCFR